MVLSGTSEGPPTVLGGRYPPWLRFRMSLRSQPPASLSLHLSGKIHRLLIRLPCCFYFRTPILPYPHVLRFVQSQRPYSIPSVPYMSILRPLGPSGPGSPETDSTGILYRHSDTRGSVNDLPSPPSYCSTPNPPSDPRDPYPVDSPSGLSSPGRSSDDGCGPLSSRPEDKRSVRRPTVGSTRFS